MSIFSLKSSKNDAILKAITVINKDTKIVGDINGEDSVVVDGLFEGNITTYASVTIGIEGKVIGDIKASKVVVCGELNGNVDTTIFEILEGAKAFSDIKTQDALVAGKVEGRLDCSDLFVDVKGNITDKVHSKNALIGGQIVGELACENLSTKETGHIKGKIYVNSLSNKGGNIEGSISEYKNIFAKEVKEMKELNESEEEKAA